MQNYQVKSTKNALQWPTLIISLLLVSNLTGCASFDFFKKEDPVKPIEIVAKPVEKTPLNIPLPDPIKVKNIKWIIVTKDNAEEVFKQLESTGTDPAVFGLSDDGYQQLSITVGEMRNLISQYREILVKYKEYYEPVKTDKTEEKK